MKQSEAKKMKVTVKVGQVVFPDGWDSFGSELRASSWDEKPNSFWLSAPIDLDAGRHVEVKVTGRTLQLRGSGSFRNWNVRCKVTWLGDVGEEDVSDGAWLEVDSFNDVEFV